MAACPQKNINIKQRCSNQEENKQGIDLKKYILLKNREKNMFNVQKVSKLSKKIVHHVNLKK